MHVRIKKEAKLSIAIEESRSDEVVTELGFNTGYEHEDVASQLNITKDNKTISDTTVTKHSNEQELTTKAEVVADLNLNLQGPVEVITMNTNDKQKHIIANSKPG